MEKTMIAVEQLSTPPLKGRKNPAVFDLLK